MNHSSIRACIASSIVFLTLCISTIAQAQSQQMIYVGTYTGPKSKGIYQLKLDMATGKLSEPEVAGETTSPSYLAIAPSKKFLYCIGEVDNFKGKRSGVVSAFAIEPGTGKLTLLNQQPSGGGGPCFIAVDKDGRNAIVANYGTGAVASLPIGEDGKLAEPASVIQHTGSGADPSRQKGPHAHSINFDPANRFAFACDLGLDKVLVYKFDATKGTLTPNDPPFATTPPASGPRHLAFHPNGKFIYVIEEMGHSITGFTYEADKGALTTIETVNTLPADFKGSNSSADIHVHPNGKFLYGSDRGSDTIAIFSIDQQTGKLTPAGHQSVLGKNPRNFGIDPTGTFLIAANQSTNNLVVFRIDPQTGSLTPTGETATVQAPVCVKFMELP